MACVQMTHRMTTRFPDGSRFGLWHSSTACTCTMCVAGLEQPKSDWHSMSCQSRATRVCGISLPGAWLKAFMRPHLHDGYLADLCNYSVAGPRQLSAE